MTSNQRLGLIVCLVLLVNPLYCEAAGQISCTPNLPTLSYPAVAMEHKTEGAVLVRFKINKKGEPTEMEVDGDPVLTPSVRLEFKWLRVSRECSGKQVSVRLTYRIDPSLPLSDAVLTRKLSDAEYEIVSPAKNVVVLADPPVTGARTRVPRAFRWLGKLKFW